jgi:hypothetical protein
LHLVLDLSLLGVAVWALYDAGSTMLALIMAGLNTVHDALSYHRIAWLIRQPGAKTTWLVLQPQFSRNVILNDHRE